MFPHVSPQGQFHVLHQSVGVVFQTHHVTEDERVEEAPIFPWNPVGSVLLG